VLAVTVVDWPAASPAVVPPAPAPTTVAASYGDGMSGTRPAPTVRPFDQPDDRPAIVELRERLSRARWPAEQAATPWMAGTPIAYVRELLDEWASGFDFEAFRRSMAQLPQFVVGIDGVDTHVVHVRSPHAEAVPIVLTHGWPSSFLELTPVISRLTRPEEHGRPAIDAFHVVIPSMPGFAHSPALPRLELLTAASTADRWQRLMSALGYERFMASGGDIGARVTAWLAARHPRTVLGAHMSVNALDSTAGETADDAERRWLARMAEWRAAEGAYMHLQQTKPLTAALATSDSPVALAAWVVEKWHAWSDSLDMADPEVRRSLLALLTLYWTTNSIGSSVLHYHAHDLPPGPRPVGVRPVAPLSFYASEAEIGGVPPRSIAHRQYGEHRWAVLPRGGHFMATEQPDLFVADLLEFRHVIRTC
jgi:pimeloyl-ACP methyl ester carboxylesterase